jgi:hypothetical protein
MTHSPQFMAAMVQLEPLIRTGKLYRKMKFGDMCDWVAYYWHRGTLSYLLQGEEAVGVCLIKLFRHLGQFLEPFVHEPCGEYCWVELLVAKEPGAIAHAYFEFKNRWGPQKIMFWDRGERTWSGCPKMFTWDQYEKLTRRLTDGMIDNEEEFYGRRRQLSTTTCAS